MNRLIKGLKRQTSCYLSQLSLSFQKLSDSGFEWDIRPIVACVVNAPGGGEGGGAEESGEYVRPSDALWQDIE